MHCSGKTLSQRGSASPCPKHDRTSLQICSHTPALHCPAENQVLNHQSPINAAKSQKHFVFQPQYCSDPWYHTVLGETEAQKSDPPKDLQPVSSLKLGLGLLTPRLPSPNASKNFTLSYSLWPEGASSGMKGVHRVIKRNPNCSLRLLISSKISP